MALPGRPLGARVQEDGLEAVDRVREPGFGRRLLLEFVPERAEFERLVRGQEAEDPVRRPGLPRVLLDHARGVVGEGVAGVDLHEVVDEEHLQDAQHVEVRRVRVLGQDDDGEAEVPRVLGVVLRPAALRAERLAEDLL